MVMSLASCFDEQALVVKLVDYMCVDQLPRRDSDRITVICLGLPMSPLFRFQRQNEFLGDNKFSEGQ